MEVAPGGYRLEMLQVRPGWLWQVLKEQAAEGISYVAFGEHDVLALRASGDTPDAFKPPDVREGVLSVHLMPLYRWHPEAGATEELGLDASATWQETPLLGIFALKIALAGAGVAARARADARTEAAVAHAVSQILPASRYAVCGGIGYFELVCLVQTNKASEIRDTLVALHGLKNPLDPGSGAFSAISPVVGIRASAERDDGKSFLIIPGEVARGEKIDAHICLDCRPGMFDAAVAANSGADLVELLAARYDLEIVVRDAPLAELAAKSIRLQDQQAEALSAVTTALSFPQTEDTATEGGQVSP